MDVDCFLQDQCHQMTRNLLGLALIFSRKSRRAATVLTSLDLANALETMNIRLEIDSKK